jgi:crotonobetainyl-CoA:carnitine CoA-transferase CaiB-like acyl-CoA transferase
MGVFQAADGFFNIGVAGPGLWKKFCSAVDKDGLYDDPRFATDEDRLKNKAELYAILGPLFAMKPATEWVDILSNAGIPAGPIYHVDEMFADPQVNHLQMAQTVSHPKRGDIELVRQPVNLSRTPARLHSALAEPGCDTDAILVGLGYDQTSVQKWRAEKVV